MSAPRLTEPVFDIDAFLEVEAHKDLLRFTTAGSVDDGKSTLIGRLLYDSKNVYEDQLHSVAKASVNRGVTSSSGALDFALLTDGLRAEREQGITIDVAYRYFATARRKFIIADTPGHEQYTRNMVTGASTAELAIILVDARNGALAQSRRHACIASLVGIPHFVVAVNKMDLVGYDQAVFEQIRTEFGDFLALLSETPFGGDGREAATAPHVTFIPISALHGDNVVEHSAKMRWYHGPSLLDHLETVEIATGASAAAPFRFPVQRVVRPDHHFRGYAGQIASGSIRPGGVVTVLPSRRRTKVTRIVTFDGELAEAWAPMSVTLELADEIDISRGDLIASVSTPAASRRFEATLVWMNERPLDLSRRYLIKHTTQTVPAEITAISRRVNIGTLAGEAASSLEMNEIGVVEINATRPLFFDSYRANPRTGCFVVIDPQTNVTAAAGMISGSSEPAPRTTPSANPAERKTAILSAWHEEAVAALRAAGFEVVIKS
jgi:sulfate adenylyltransferase large subunit